MKVICAFCVLVVLLFSSCGSGDESENKNLTSEEEKSKVQEDSNIVEHAATIDLTEFYSKLNDKPVDLKQLSKDEKIFINFVLSPSNLDSSVYVPDGFQTGVYPLSYVKPDRKKLKDVTVLGKVFVARQKSDKNWLMGDPTEIIIALELSSPAVKMLNQFNVGQNKSDIITQLGEPNENDNNLLTYWKKEQNYALNLKFFIASDTVSKIIFQKVKE